MGVTGQASRRSLLRRRHSALRESWGLGLSPWNFTPSFLPRGGTVGTAATFVAEPNWPNGEKRPRPEMIGRSERRTREEETDSGLERAETGQEGPAMATGEVGAVAGLAVGVGA